MRLSWMKEIVEGSLNMGIMRWIRLTMGEGMGGSSSFGLLADPGPARVTRSRFWAPFAAGGGAGFRGTGGAFALPQAANVSKLSVGREKRKV
jgi:hypothetical protein